MSSREMEGSKKGEGALVAGVEATKDKALKTEWSGEKAFRRA